MPKRKKTESPSPEAQQLLREKELIHQTTQTIYAVMEKNGVTKAELARRLGKTNAYVSQLLSGDRNLTLRTIADIALALEIYPRVVLSEKR
jgi:transcriptional regulator with XRE-family HTH domain